MSFEDVVRQMEQKQLHRRKTNSRNLCSRYQAINFLERRGGGR